MRFKRCGNANCNVEGRGRWLARCRLGMEEEVETHSFLGRLHLRRDRVLLANVALGRSSVKQSKLAVEGLEEVERL